MQLHKAIAAEKGSELEKYILARAAKNFYLRDQTERFDLYPFYAILVTAGITNRNFDHFDVEQTYVARHSPLDKPVNLGHSADAICGHILDCIAVDDELRPLKEPTESGDLPTRLHLVISAVIYKVWENPQKQAQINDVIDKISKGQIYVSMEALFRDFAYLLTHASTGEQKIIERNEKTSGLTKYLRQYKGPGRIYDYELARVLKNITFSAVGIVDKPANPESIISASLDLFSGNNLSFANDNTSLASENEQVYINLDSTKSGEINMAEKTEAAKDGGGFEHDYPKGDKKSDDMENVKCENDTLKRENAHLHSLVAELNTKVESLTKATSPKDEPEGKDRPKVEVEKERDSTGPGKDYPNPPGTGKKNLRGKDKSSYAETTMADDSTDDTMKEMAELQSTVASLRNDVKTLSSKNTELTTANDALNATIDAFKKASRHSDRAEAMMKIDNSLTRETALQAVAKMDELSDVGFAYTLEMMKGYASKSPKEVTPESILASAKAEKDAPMGAKAEDEIQKTTADIKKFLSRKTKLASANKE